MKDKSKNEYFLSENQINEKLLQAENFEKGTLEDEIIISYKKNWNYNPDDMSYDAVPEFTEEQTIIPKGTGKNYDAALKLYKKIESALTNQLNLWIKNTSSYSGKDQEDADAKKYELQQRINGIKVKIQALETIVDERTYKPKLNKLVLAYIELLEHYEEKVKNKYGADFFDQDDEVQATYMTEKVKYENEPNDIKDPGPFLLWVATNNMIRGLETVNHQEDAHKPFFNKINTWFQLYKGEDGEIIKADRGDFAVRIGNEIARILNALVTFEYKKEFEFFKSRGKEQENKVQEAINLPQSMKR